MRAGSIDCGANLALPRPFRFSDAGRCSLSPAVRPGSAGIAQMPLCLAPLMGWLVGLGLAWAARDDRGWEESPLVTSRPFVVTVAFASFVYTPVVGYFAAFHGDWGYLYIAPGRAIPSALDLALVLFSGASIPLGLAIGARAEIGRAHV